MRGQPRLARTGLARMSPTLASEAAEDGWREQGWRGRARHWPARRLAVAEVQIATVSATAGDIHDEPVLRVGDACGGARVEARLAVGGAVPGDAGEGFGDAGVVAGGAPGDVGTEVGWRTATVAETWCSWWAEAPGARQGLGVQWAAAGSRRWRPTAPEGELDSKKATAMRLARAG